MLPLALKLEPGAESRAPMAVVVIGGLLSSTFLAIFVTPALYTLLDDLQRIVIRPSEHLSWCQRRRSTRLPPEPAPVPVVAASAVATENGNGANGHTNDANGANGNGHANGTWERSHGARVAPAPQNGLVRRLAFFRQSSGFGRLAFRR
jgi:hypothetical protein